MRVSSSSRRLNHEWLRFWRTLFHRDCECFHPPCRPERESPAEISPSVPHASDGPVKVKVAQSCLTLCNHVDYIVHGIPQATLLEWVPFPSPGDLPNPGIKPRSPTLWADSLPAEPQRKPKNTGVGSLFLLQQIFPTQESNRGLLHCRRILYQLSYQGSPQMGLRAPVL